MITVVLVDDHPLVRQGLRAVIDQAPDIQVLGEAADGEDAITVCAEHQPDVVLLDIKMPTMDGVAATREILARSSGTSVLILTMYDDDAMVFQAVSAGASGYLLKGADGAEIVAAIKAAAAGQAVFGAALAQRIRSWFTNPLPAAAPFGNLTERERDILEGVAQGRTNAEIGADLFLSPKTVANNVSRILDKLQLAHRSEAIIKARDAGIGRGAEPR